MSAAATFLRDEDKRWRYVMAYHEEGKAWNQTFQSGEVLQMLEKTCTPSPRKSSTRVNYSTVMYCLGCGSIMLLARFTRHRIRAVLASTAASIPEIQRRAGVVLQPATPALSPHARKTKFPPVPAKSERRVTRTQTRLQANAASRGGSDISGIEIGNTIESEQQRTRDNSRGSNNRNRQNDAPGSRQNNAANAVPPARQSPSPSSIPCSIHTLLALFFLVVLACVFYFEAQLWNQYAIPVEEFTVLRQEFRGFREYELDRRMKHGFELSELKDRVKKLEGKWFWW
ncbi:hypothetical protein MMC30_008904 [Trapelia coarctata]|nr:hypothetical protein [Trapelia coarctata]